MFARRQVADYAAWCKVHDAFDRGLLGIREHAAASDRRFLHRMQPASGPRRRLT